MRSNATSVSVRSALAYLLLLLPGLLLLPIGDLSAAELRVVDTSGLVRSAKVIEDSADVIIEISSANGAGETCTLKNVDGLAADKTVTASQGATGKLECRFQGVPAGTWQGAITSRGRWQVRIGK